MSSTRPGPRLFARRSECEALDRLVERATAGQSSALVLRAEAGGGKTALLDYVAGRAPAYRIARAAGVEAEMELAFAGLHQLCAPLLDRLDDLPGPQRDALRTAFGLWEGAAPDRFHVGLAALSLLSEAAGDRPLVCLIDDAQWLDRASVQCLAFVARRLAAEPVALVFAVREPMEDRALIGLPELVLPGLGESDARALLASVITGPLDEHVRDRIIAETGGNPLALLELPRGLTSDELAGGFAFPNTRPLPNRIEQSFALRLQSLPNETQRLLLVAASEPVGDVSLLWRAAQLLGIGADAAVPAEAAGLIELGVRVRFRHPLVRSAAYRAASWRDRQGVHRALAESTDPEIDPDRRAWHRAGASPGPDEAVADELERSAERAQGRGGVAAAAAFLQRATELTSDPARLGARALAAAQAKFDAGAPDAASGLLATAEMRPLDDLQRARFERLRAQIAFARRRGADDPPLLLDAANRLAPLNAALARETYLEALGAAIFAGRLSGVVGVRRAAEAAQGAPPAPAPPRAIDLLLDGLATRFTEGYAAAVAPLRRALLAFCGDDGRNEEDIHWLWLACRIAEDLWDDEMWHELATRGVTLARDAGALTVLPIAATYRAGVHVHAGEFAAASALIEEADALTEATGNPPLGYTSIVLAAWRGERSQASELIEAGARDATARGEGRGIALAEYATAVLHNGLGRYEAALAAAQRGAEHDDLGLFAWSLIELVEAGVRTGEPEVAAAAARQIGGQARASGSDWALGIDARSRAMLTDGPAAEALYREAVERLARSRIAVQLARTHLLYGEWLRREKRRLDARRQLRLAHEMFSGMGAEAFAERARRELLATGETVRKRTVEASAGLTAQEAQIAQLARDGQTNPQIGAELFISSRTVEWHLAKVFAKLDISSRRELRDALPNGGLPAMSA
jgi:DNA-binding CsgD family transcriptional regulator